MFDESTELLIYGALAAGIVGAIMFHVQRKPGAERPKESWNRRLLRIAVIFLLMLLAGLTITRNYSFAIAFLPVVILLARFGWSR